MITIRNKMKIWDRFFRIMRLIEGRLSEIFVCSFKQKTQAGFKVQNVRSRNNKPAVRL